MCDISSSSSQWLDAGACALLAQESVLLQCLAGTPQLVHVGLPQLQEAWTQLWSTAQQVSTDAASIVVSQLAHASRWCTRQSQPQLWLLLLHSSSSV